MVQGIGFNPNSQKQDTTTTAKARTIDPKKIDIGLVRRNQGTNSASQTKSTTGNDNIGKTADLLTNIGKLMTDSVMGGMKIFNTAQVSGMDAMSNLMDVQAPLNFATIPLGGNAQTGKAVAMMLDNMLTNPNGEIGFTSDDWKTLANKPNKTPEDIKKLDAEYNTNIQKLGNSMTKYISESFASGGDINLDAFTKFQSNGAMNLSGLTAEQKAQLKTSYETAFNRLDINKDGKLDEKEMSAFMHALDFDSNNKMNGKITSADYYTAASSLDDPNQNIMDKKLSYCYNKLYGNE